MRSTALLIAAFAAAACGVNIQPGPASLHSFATPSGGCSCVQYSKMSRAVAKDYYTQGTLDGFMQGAVDYAGKQRLEKRQSTNGTVAQIFKGNVVTMAEGQESNSYEAMAVDATGKIVFVGTAADAANLPGAATAKVNDYTGKTIMPGFWDNHNHFFSTGLGYADPNNLMCYYPRIKTIQELNAELSAQATKLDAAGVPNNKTSIFGFGWDLLLQQPFRHLNRQDLDAISETRTSQLSHPSVLTRLRTSRCYCKHCTHGLRQFCCSCRCKHHQGHASLPRRWSV